MTLSPNKILLVPDAQIHSNPLDVKVMQESFETLMRFNQKKMLVDTKVAMLDSASDSLSKALNANIKQSDSINF